MLNSENATAVNYILFKTDVHTHTHTDVHTHTHTHTHKAITSFKGQSCLTFCKLKAFLIFMTLSQSAASHMQIQ